VLLSFRSDGLVANTTFGEVFGGDFSGFGQKKIVCGGVAFLLAFLPFLMCFVVVNRGEFVVECVAKRGLLTVTFLRSKNRTAFSSLFFWILR
jgi:hypothetical protein